MKCHLQKQCGGCQYLDKRVSDIQKIKTDQVNVLLKKHRIQAKVSNTHMAKQDTHYRNKVIVGFAKQKGKVFAGLYAQGSHRVIHTKNCLMQPKRVNELIEYFAYLVQSMKIELYNEKTRTGTLRHVLIRYSQSTNQMLVMIVSAKRQFPSRKNLVKALTKKFPEIRSILFSINDRNTSVVVEDVGYPIYGDGFISDTLCDLDFTYSASNFYQIHHDQCEVLYALANQFLQMKPNEVLLDTYCGIGTIGMSLAKDCKQVIGVEINKQSIQSAKYNQKRNNITNMEFVCADSTKFMNEAAIHHQKVDALVLDPPRAGTTRDFIESVFRLKPSKVCYISCDPKTLARDLELFQKQYKVQRIELVDMFPYTKHVESVVLMSRKDR